MYVTPTQLLLDRVQTTTGWSQAELARRMGVTDASTSRWASGKSTLDYENCLRLARITGLSPRQILTEIGLDPDLLPLPEPPADLTPVQRDLFERGARVQAAVDAADGLPDDFVPVYLGKILDNTEEEVLSTIKMVMNIRHAAAVTARKRRPVSEPTRGANMSEAGPPPEVQHSYRVQPQNPPTSVTHLGLDSRVVPIRWAPALAGIIG